MRQKHSKLQKDFILLMCYYVEYVCLFWPEASYALARSEAPPVIIKALIR